MSAAGFGLISVERNVKMPGGRIPSLAKDGFTKTPVNYLDYTVDGTQLAERLGVREPEFLDYVGVIQDARPFETVTAIKRLLNETPGDLPDGRVSLYACPECGDLACGAVTATIVIEHETVTWRAIGIQTDYDDEVFPLDGVDDADVTFHRRTYEGVLRRELERLRLLSAGLEYPSQRPHPRRPERRNLLRWLRRGR